MFCCNQSVRRIRHLPVNHDLHTARPLNIQTLSNLQSRVEWPYDVRRLIRKKGLDCIALVSITTSVAVSAQTSLRSPQTLFIVIIKSFIYRIKVSKWWFIFEKIFTHEDIVLPACCRAGCCFKALMKNVTVWMLSGHAVCCCDEAIYHCIVSESQWTLDITNHFLP